MPCGRASITTSQPATLIQNALAAAATVTVPTTVIVGERDMMIPVKAGKALAAAVANAKTVVLPGAGTYR